MLRFLKDYVSLSVAKKMLSRFLIIDLVFIIIHIVVCLVYYLGYIKNFGDYQFLVLTQDESFAELFQYFKYVVFIWITVRLILKEKSYGYVSWIVLFLFFLLDDSLALHEWAGEYLAEKYSFTPKFWLRAVDFGELIFMAIAGSIVLLTLAITYFNSGSIFKERTNSILFLLVFLILFGVGFDMLMIVLGENLKVAFAIGLIEDGGEMLIVTFMVCYAYQLLKPVEKYRLI